MLCICLLFQEVVWFDKVQTGPVVLYSMYFSPVPAPDLTAELSISGPHSDFLTGENISVQVDQVFKL